MGPQTKLLMFRLMGFVLNNCESGVIKTLSGAQSCVGSKLLDDRLSLKRQKREVVNNFAQKNIFASKQNYLYNDLLIAADYKWDRLTPAPKTSIGSTWTACPISCKSCSITGTCSWSGSSTSTSTGFWARSANSTRTRAGPLPSGACSPR